MQKINYRFTYILFYILFVIFSLFILQYIFEQSSSTNIEKISKENIEKKFKERKSYIEDFFDNYKNSLIALSQNKTINDYINGKNNIEDVQSLFLTAKRSLPSALKIRIIDLNGNEIVKVYGTPIISYKEKNISKIATNSELQNKYSRYYFHRFKKLNKGEVGLSKIDLQREYGKVAKPKRATLRVATPLYDKSNNKKGILVFSISLKKLFENLKKSSIYHIMIAENDTRFILHYKENKGLTSSTYKTFLLQDEFGKNRVSDIILNKTFVSEDFYSSLLENLNTGQELKMILKPKFQKLIKENEESKLNIYFLLIFLSFVFLPVVFYFAKIPELLKDKIYEQAITDSLTGLPNRSHLLKDLNKHKFLDAAIILVHIDNYDKIQTAYGYKIAENLIKEVSTYLNDYSINHRDYLKVYKVSKNCFALKFEIKTGTNFNNIVEELHRNIENKVFEPAKNFEILANCTIATSDPINLNNNLNELKEAELALSGALENSLEINIYDNEDFNKIELNKKNIDMVNEIKRAIDTNNIIVQFQPIYNNIQEKIDKYETLIRLKDSKGEIIYPGQFLDIAKDIKKYKKLTKIIIEKSFEYFKDKDYEFSINLSIEDISNKNVREFLFDKIKEFDIQNKLVLEIVESEAIENYNDFINFIKKAKELGCKIAIDDFGSGYSNYEYIVNLSDYIDYLKIDGSLILGINENPKRQLLVGTLKFLCDSLNIKTIAEYIESEELFDYVKSMGINYSQGFYIGRSQDEI